MELHMAKNSLDGRYRNTTGRVEKKHGSCASLRETRQPCRGLPQGQDPQNIAGRNADGITPRSSAQTAQMGFSNKLQPIAVFVFALALWLNSGSAQAGPCTADISQFE